MKGFILVEMIVSIAISSIVGLALFSILFQVQQSEQTVATTVATGVQVAVITERLQKDLTGMLWPQFESNQIAAPIEKKSEKPKVEQAAALPEITKIIFSQNSLIGDMTNLKELTFITANPLQVYGNAKPRLARVIYTLVPQTQEGTFALCRQEASDLDYKQAKEEAQTYILAEGLRCLKFTYFYEKEATEPNSGGENLIQQTELDSDVFTAQNDLATLVNRVPRYIKVDLSLWEDAKQKLFTDFDFWFYINMASKKTAKQLELNSAEA